MMLPIYFGSTQLRHTFEKDMIFVVRLVMIMIELFVAIFGIFSGKNYRWKIEIARLDNNLVLTVEKSFEFSQSTFCLVFIRSGLTVIKFFNKT
jgi:hypothetical protein